MPLISVSGASPPTVYVLARVSYQQSYELWKSDGTAVGTTRVKGGFGYYGFYAPASLVNVQGTLFFTSNGQLWKSDGTEAGTVTVGSSSFTSPSQLTAVGSSLFFVASTSTTGGELWKSDGTTDGTMLVKDIQPGVYASAIRSLVNVNGVLFLVAEDGTHGLELWKSDSTADGTVLIKDIAPGSRPCVPSSALKNNTPFTLTKLPIPDG